jgi:predicted helicase
MWSEWPGRGKRPDTGIDIVAEEREGGGICAIQCKFYAPQHRLEKSDLDSFFATSVKRIVRVSVETERIVKGLPALEELKP